MKNLTLASSVIALLACTATTALGQTPVIASFSRNGKLVCTNLLPGTTAVVEWAPTVNGPWTNTWAGLEVVVPDSNGMIRVSVPMFYRVRSLQANPDPVPLVWIPPGTFTMGSPPDEPARSSEEGPQTTVTISRGFWMGRYEVTQAQYLDVIGLNPSQVQSGNLPVERVNWFEATNFCGKLSERERGAGRLPAGYVYRLPTEAQWEYACRAGTTTAFHYGNELRSGMANFDGHYEYPPCGVDVFWCYNPVGTAQYRSTPVGSYVPNAWGLYDMHGNVFEWCQDWMAYNLPGESVTDPTGPVTGDGRVLRGGNKSIQGRGCRSAHRRTQSPTWLEIGIGFRVALVPVH